MWDYLKEVLEARRSKLGQLERGDEGHQRLFSVTSSISCEVGAVFEF